MKMWLLFMGVAALYVPPGVAADSNPLSALQAAYIQWIAGIESKYRRYDLERPARYQDSLKLLQKRLQEAGDFDGWKAVQAEIDRHAREKTIPKDGSTTEPAELGSLQAQFAAGRRMQSLQKSRDILDMTRRYTERLREVRTELTRKGDMAAAVAVDEEIRKVAQNPHVTAAEFEVKILGGAANQAPEPESPPAGEQPEQGDDPPPAEAREVKGPDVSVYAGGESPPRVDGIILKRISASRTDHSPLLTPVSLSLWEDRRDDARPFIRLGIRSRSVDTVVPTVHVVVDYYTMMPRARGEDAYRAGRRYLVLKNVSTDQVHVDCRPLTNPWGERRTALSFWEQHRFEHGNEFYGLVVSLYDSEGNLMFQGSSPRSLKELAQVERASVVLGEELRHSDPNRQEGDERRKALWRRIDEKRRAREEAMEARGERGPRRRGDGE
jgi:hypothetical protein